jgi:hypothetical protein
LLLLLLLLLFSSIFISELTIRSIWEAFWDSWETLQEK